MHYSTFWNKYHTLHRYARFYFRSPIEVWICFVIFSPKVKENRLLLEGGLLMTRKRKSFLEFHCHYEKAAFLVCTTAVAVWLMHLLTTSATTLAEILMVTCHANKGQSLLLTLQHATEPQIITILPCFWCTFYLQLRPSVPWENWLRVLNILANAYKLIFQNYWKVVVGHQRVQKVGSRVMFWTFSFNKAILKVDSLKVLELLIDHWWGLKVDYFTLQCFGDVMAPSRVSKWLGIYFSCLK